MRLLYVHGSSVIPGIIVALQRINVDVVVYPKRQTDIFLNEMWVHSPPLGAQANFNRTEKHDTM